MIFRRPADDRGSLPMALLVIMIGVLSSAVLTPIVVRQITTTRTLNARNTELDAAETGLDVMMARVRAASTVTSTGVISGLLEALPGCSLSGDGGASGTGENLSYGVTVQYFDQDGNNISNTTCPPSDVPTTATVTSVGYGPNGAQRTLVATYSFTTSNTNIPGGAIRIDTSSAGNLCFDAGSVKPATGYQVTMQTCNGGSRQQFGYTSDLYLKLVNSESGTAQFGMCLYAGTPVSGQTHKSGDLLNFQPCPATRTGLFQWSLDGSSQFHSTNTAQGIESLCVNVQQANTLGSNVVLGSCGTSLTLDIFRSEPGVGAGMAGDSTNQLVNYAQFSRCLDVTGQSTTATYMIAWFCKQSPTGGVDWNQQWVHPTPTGTAVSATGNIIVTKSGTKYCLKSPLSVAANAYTTVVACPTGNVDGTKGVTDLSQLWTVYHDTGDYGTSYRIMDTSGFCLTPTDLNAVPKDVHTDGTSKVKVATCSTNELQKWNAPPNINKPTPLVNLTEK